ncbi:MAG: hypothetical protein R3F59_04905 [Myxococcota bacterium]
MRTWGAVGVCVWLLGSCAGDKDPTTPTSDEADTDADSDSDSDADTDSDSDTDTDTAGTVDCLGARVIQTVPTGTGGPTTSTGSTGTSTTTTTTTTTPTTTTTTTTPPTGDTAASTGDTGLPTGGVLWFDARYGIDDDGCLGSVLIDGTEVIPQLNLRIGEDAWVVGDFADTAHYCTVQLQLQTGSINDSWVTSVPALAWGVTHDGVTIATDCDDARLAQRWGADPLGHLLSLGPWGGAVGRMDPYVQSYLQGAGVDLTNVWGGAMLLPELSSAPYPSVYTYALEVDADANLVFDALDNAVFIPAADLDLGGGQLARAYYVQYSLFVQPY